jgi:hypothetical protein
MKESGYLTSASPFKFPVPAFVATAAYAGTQKEVDTTTPPGVSLGQSPMTATHLKGQTMTLTFKSLSRNGKNAFYSGAATTLRFALSVFPNKSYPQTITVPDDTFASPRAVKVKTTVAERKAARAALPKPTLAERAAKAQKRADELKAKLADQHAGM